MPGQKSVQLTHDRLQRPAQLIEELDPDGFCIVAYTIPDAGQDGEEGKLVATASAKPYVPPGKAEGGSKLSDNEVKEMFQRAEPAQVMSDTASSAGAEEEDEETLPTWEICAMVVDPELQGRGIASQLMSLAINTIRRQVRDELQTQVGDREGKGKVRLFLTTLKELNEEYYKRKGWTTTSERRFGPGVGGSEAGFGVVDMVRVVDG